MFIETVKQKNRLTKVSLLSSNLPRKESRANAEMKNTTPAQTYEIFRYIPTSRSGSWTKIPERGRWVFNRHVSNHQREFLAVRLSQCYKHFATQSKPARRVSIRYVVSLAIIGSCDDSLSVRKGLLPALIRTARRDQTAAIDPKRIRILNCPRVCKKECV